MRRHFYSVWNQTIPKRNCILIFFAVQKHDTYVFLKKEDDKKWDFYSLSEKHAQKPDTMRKSTRDNEMNNNKNFWSLVETIYFPTNTNVTQFCRSVREKKEKKLIQTTWIQCTYALENDDDEEKEKCENRNVLVQI